MAFAKIFMEPGDKWLVFGLALFVFVFLPLMVLNFLFLPITLYLGIKNRITDFLVFTFLSLHFQFL